MPESFDADELARCICASVGWDWRDAVGLSNGLGIEVFGFPDHLVHGDAELVRIDRRHVIHVRSSLRPERLAFSLLHEIGHYALGDYCVKEHAEEERKANRIAAALQMPLHQFIRDVILRGVDFPALARKHFATETAAALRYAEVTGEPLAVITPSRVHVAGEPHPWPSELELRWRVKRGLVKTVPILDEPGRVAVLAG